MSKHPQNLSENKFLVINNRWRANFFFAKSCSGNSNGHFEPSVKSLGVMVRFAGKNAQNPPKTDFCPPGRMPLWNQRFLRFTKIPPFYY